VKLGGLAMIVNAFDFHLTPLPPSSGELANAWQPYVETCIQDFGVDRCMFESNFPVDKGASSYRCCSTPSSGWRAAPPRRRKRPICSPAPHRGSAG
jgi:hypothetical protein